MKTPLSLSLALLCCLALLGGCAKTDAPAAPEPSAQTEQSAAALTYEIEHTDLSEGLPVEMFFEIPVFSGESDAARRINADLADVKRAYLENDAPAVLETVREMTGTEYGPTPEAPYCNARTATVHTCDAALVSVTIAYDWYMGGVMDYGVDSYAYDAVTGERLTLRDLIDAPDDDIRASIADAFLAQYPDSEDAGVTEPPADAIRAMDVADFHFYVEDGKAHVVFNKYEITCGAAGMFDVVLPDALGR